MNTVSEQTVHQFANPAGRRGVGGLVPPKGRIRYHPWPHAQIFFWKAESFDLFSQNQRNQRSAADQGVGGLDLWLPRSPGPHGSFVRKKLELNRESPPAGPGAPGGGGLKPLGPFRGGPVGQGRVFVCKIADLFFWEADHKRSRNSGAGHWSELNRADLGPKAARKNVAKFRVGG
jgi:hypothetical protein